MSRPFQDSPSLEVINKYIGLKFGRLNIVSFERRVRGKNKTIHFFNYICDCGKQGVISTSNINRTKSCGCLSLEVLLSRMRKNPMYGKGSTRLCNIWRGIIRRCYNSKRNNYERYGGRGITVCDEWRNNFLCFEEWALKNGYNGTLSIDRIDNNKEYSPLNCKWSTVKEQSNNRRSNIYIEYNGENLTAKDWSLRIGKNKNLVAGRLRNGWDKIDAITVKSRNKPK